MSASSMGAKATRAHHPRAPRYPFRQAVRVQSVDSDRVLTNGPSGNLSREGMFIRSEAPVELGTQVRVMLETPSGPRAFADGQVVWIRPPSGHMRQEAPGFGLRFLSLHPGATELIRFLLGGRPLTWGSPTPAAQELFQTFLKQ